MPRGVQTARNARTVPSVQSVAYTTGQVFKKGAVLLMTAAGEVSEAAADPLSVYGVALQPAGSGLGYGSSNPGETTVVTGRLQEVSVAVADRVSEFSARGVNGGTDPVVPLQTHIGELYGMKKVADDWVIDFASVVDVVQITDIVPAEGGSGGFFLFKFIEAVLAQP